MYEPRIGAEGNASAEGENSSGGVPESFWDETPHRTVYGYRVPTHPLDLFVLVVGTLIISPFIVIAEGEWYDAVALAGVYLAIGAGVVGLAIVVGPDIVGAWDVAAAQVEQWAASVGAYIDRHPLEASKAAIAAGIALAIVGLGVRGGSDA